jgi:hypothetical protein
MGAVFTVNTFYLFITTSLHEMADVTFVRPLVHLCAHIISKSSEYILIKSGISYLSYTLWCEHSLLPCTLVSVHGVL